MLEPAIGFCTEAVVDMQGQNEQAEWLGGRNRRVQERGRVAPAAVGDSDGSSRRRCIGLSARWCR